MPAAAEASRGSRKMVTVLFADVVGSTALGERLDPETMRAALGRYFGAARAVLERHGGTVEKFIGDAVMAVFGIPLLHEDDALRAARAALELRDEIGRLNDQLATERGLRVEFRIGVNSGMVVAGGEGSGSFVTGDAVNVAARLEQAAGAGEVLVGDATYRLVRDYVEAESIPPLAAKGKSEAVRAYRLTGVVGGVGAAVRSSERAGSFVGRRRELSRLGEAFDDAVAERRCFLFTLLGSAGVGKSRLVAEFIGAHAVEAEVLRGRCLPYGDGITYWPIAEIVRAATGATDDEDMVTLRGRIVDALADDTAADRVADLLVSMLGLSTANAPAEERSWAVRRFLERIAREKPLICLVEDVHWAEASLLDLLENLADWTRDAPILLLCTARAELLESRPTWGGGKVNATTILLEPLNADLTRELIGGLLGKTALESSLVERILAASEGNPLFAEEIVRMLAEEDPTHDVTRRADEIHIPTSVQAVIAARLDRLPVEERVVAERAAVAGRIFERSAVLELVRDDERERVPGALLGLMRKELVQPSQPDVTADEAFRFRHMLIRDTAYEGLPKQDRADLHERFAGWVERVAGERIDEYAEIMGYHLEQAARYRRELGIEDARSADLARRAGECLAGAGLRAYQRGEQTAAIKLLGRAIELLPPGQARRAALVTHCLAATFSGDYATALSAAYRLVDEAKAAGDVVAELKGRLLTIEPQTFGDPSYVGANAMPEVKAAVAEFERIGDDQGVAIARHASSTILLGLAQWERSRAEAELGLRHALAGDDGPIADGLRYRIINGALWGPMPVAEFLSDADELIATTGSSTTKAYFVGLRAFGHAMAGNAAQARADIEEMLRIRRELADPTLAWAFNSTPVEQVLGDLDAAEEFGRATVAVLEKTGETGQRSTIFGFRARIAFDRGRPDSEVIAFAEECRHFAAADDTVSQLQWRAALALVAARAGRTDEAKRLIDEATEMFEANESDFVYELGLTAQDRGYIHGAAGEVDEARRWYQRALELFESKGDVMDAARVSQRLAELS